MLINFSCQNKQDRQHSKRETHAAHDHSGNCQTFSAVGIRIFINVRHPDKAGDQRRESEIKSAITANQKQAQNAENHRDCGQRLILPLRPGRCHERLILLLLQRLILLPRWRKRRLAGPILIGRSRLIHQNCRRRVVIDGRQDPAICKAKIQLVIDIFLLAIWTNFHTKWKKSVRRNQPYRTKFRLQSNITAYISLIESGRKCKFSMEILRQSGSAPTAKFDVRRK